MRLPPDDSAPFGKAERDRSSSFAALFPNSDIGIGSRIVTFPAHLILLIGPDGGPFSCMGASGTLMLDATALRSRGAMRTSGAGSLPTIARETPECLAG